MTAIGATAAARPQRSTPPLSNRIPGLLLLAAAVVAPFVVDDFRTFELTQIAIYAIAILGLNLLTGINGQFSLGHGAFFAVGAYATAMLITHGGVPYPLAIPLAGLCCFVLGYGFGFPAVKLEGIYLALATFALAVATPQFLKLSPLEHWTGGVSGLILDKPEAPFGLPLNPDQWLYFLTVAVGLVLYLLLRNLVSGRTGRAFRAIKDNQLAARAMGIDVTRTKVLAFGYSALITGVAGALSAIVVQFVAPDSFSFFLSVSLLVGLVVGGVGWLPGAIVGAAFVYYVPTWAEEVSQGMQGAVYGVLLILVIYIVPRGFGGLVEAVKGFVTKKLD